MVFVCGVVSRFVLAVLVVRENGVCRCLRRGISLSFVLFVFVCGDCGICVCVCVCVVCVCCVCGVYVVCGVWCVLFCTLGFSCVYGVFCV